MELNTKLNTNIRTPKKKSLIRKIWRFFWVTSLIILIGGSAFLYGTDKGYQMRSMAVGTLMSTNHTAHLKFLRLLLPQSEIDALYAARVRPTSQQSKLENEKKDTKKYPETSSQTITVDTIEEATYTAKIMTIPDPTTIHIVGTKHENKGQALSELITENKGIAGINAGGFIDPNGVGSGGQPVGIVIGRGKIITLPNNDRNAKQLSAGFLKNGKFITGTYSADELLKLGVTDAVSFGPQLIVDGVNQITPAIDGAWGWAPRTALGQKKNGSVVMIITDGRFYWDKTHRGASMSEMAKMFEKYGVENAIAMDGGGSTTMIKDGALQLKPATDTRAGMRYLPNAWVVIPHS